MFALFAITMLFCVSQSAAQSSDGKAAPTVVAASREGSILIDGRLTETAWQKAQPATRFVQGEPVEGAPAEEPTAVRVLFDPAALYVGVEMHEPKPELIGDQLVRRDDEGACDYFELSLDSNNDRLTGYRFRVSAAGVQRDVYLYDDVRDDEAWDAVWDSAVHRDSTGWSAELRIPLSQLRYDSADSTQSWGVNFSRRRLASNERSYFALESRIEHGTVSAFGRLEGLRFSSSSRQLELRPYVLSNADTGPSESGDPFFDGSQMTGRAGLDLRYGLGGTYTLDMTLNPDFGQVEVDPAVINLTAFETFFPEKRPFFIEDAQIFDFDLSGRRNRLFHSRRIGREPRGSAPDKADFEDIPTQTTILGAAKLTGRTPGGLAVGALAALTARENGRAYVSSQEQTKRFPVEPRSLYGVARVRQDFRKGASQIGAIVTAMRRDLPNNGSLDELTSSAFSFGVDFQHNWGGRRSRNWALTGHAVGSFIKGSRTALEKVQTSSNHYFQRPDATRFSLNPKATSLTGMEWQIEFARRSAKHWTGNFWVGETTPGFEINDLGFATSGERLTTGGRISYQEITPGSFFRNYEFRLFTFHSWRHELFDNLKSFTRAYQSGRLFISAEAELLNYWGVELQMRYSPQALSSTATRGGPLMVRPASLSFEIRGNTDRRKDLFFEPSVSFEDRVLGAYEWQMGLEVAVRPSPSWEIELEPNYSNELNPAQYVDTADDIGYAPTFGNGYLFGELKRQSFSLETRINIAFNPKLTLQFYAQPLISSGQYIEYKQLQRSESFDFDVFEEGAPVVGTDDVSCVDGRTCVYDGERYIDFDGDGKTDFSFSDKDFNIRSLRLNAVLRWEYRPGSTLFLVWQQSRRSEDNVGSFNLDDSLSALWDTQPENAFILKLNYWFDL